MKFLKKVLILIIALVGIVLILALFVEKEYDVNRSITINQPKTDVFNFVKLLKNQNEYSVWNQMDPKVKQTYKGTDGTPGFVYSWNSKNEEVGVGEQEIMHVTEGEKIEFELRFKEPMEMIGEAYITTKELNGATNVTWGFKGESPYPFNVFLLFFNMDDALGPDLQQGLDNLKVLLESED